MLSPKSRKPAAIGDQGADDFAVDVVKQQIFLSSLHLSRRSTALCTEKWRSNTNRSSDNPYNYLSIRCVRQLYQVKQLPLLKMTSFYRGMNEFNIYSRTLSRSHPACTRLLC